MPLVGFEPEVPVEPGVPVGGLEPDVSVPVLEPEVLFFFAERARRSVPLPVVPAPADAPVSLVPVAEPGLLPTSVDDVPLGVAPPAAELELPPGCVRRRFPGRVRVVVPDDVVPPVVSPPVDPGEVDDPVPPYVPLPDPVGRVPPGAPLPEPGEPVVPVPVPPYVPEPVDPLPVVPLPAPVVPVPDPGVPLPDPGDPEVPVPVPP